jgi:hypothetical protein
MDKKTKSEKTAAREPKKTPFFARYLATQELASVSSGQTLKFPSDSDDEDWP